MNNRQPHTPDAFRLLFYFLLFVIGNSCHPAPQAQKIVDAAIQSSGLDRLENATVDFDFRNMHYIYKRNNGLFEYTRIQKDTTGTEIRDMLTNEVLVRYIADTVVTLTDERRKAYTRSVNSVMYFAFLPLRLNDPATNKRYLGIDTLNGREYHQIEITFDQQGGGRDFEDKFYYWFDIEDNSMDYMAYEYILDGGGIRFREAYNSRQIKGVTIQDYRNYKPVSDSITLEEISSAFEDKELELLSTIDLRNMEINISLRE